MNIKERIRILRGIMEELGIQAYIIPSSDAHQSEYVSEYFKCRQWISGFTGSAGTVVITANEAGLWTDGRYYIQAENQLKNSGIKLFKASDIGVPTYLQWLNDILEEGSTVGFDGNVVSVSMAREVVNALKGKNINVVSRYDLINMIWSDRPELSKEKIFMHDIKFSGKSRGEKLAAVRNKMKEIGGNCHFLSSLDDIAWLLNIRGSDVPSNPVVISYLLLTENECYLFIDPKKVTDEVNNELEAEGITIRNYNKVHSYLEDLTEEDAIILDINKVNYNLYNAINKEVIKIECGNITTGIKAIKNDIEIDNLKDCQISDGVSMVKLIKWLKESVGNIALTELTVNEKLLELRKENEHFVGPSFDSIIGYKENAAMMHYKAVKGKEAVLKKEGFLLIDSGGQYYTGTTDITRTIALGHLTEEEKLDFTLVLKGNIALNRIKFLYGTTGSNLDVIARQPIWEYGMDYKCGTGHGVGFFLNVHEGPHRIAQLQNDIKLEKGMVITNEPGIYKEGKHGIRTENMMVVDQDEKNEFGQFMKFEAITYCPIDLEAIKVEMLNNYEKEWLNNYHRGVFEKLSVKLSIEEKEWLRRATRAI